ncbi:MAG: ABC transporter ATP-binding protein [Bacteroidales bacterium]|jgi:ABC-2 type transport system ATP-binding protein
MIKVENIKKTYLGKNVLDIGNLMINKGEFLGIVGNNGAGKTTFFRLILDLIRADSGCICLNNISVSNSEKWKSFTGSYLDESFLIDFLTPEEFFSFLGKIYHITNEQIEEKLKSFIHFFNNEILNQNGKYIREYSDGNKQKIGIFSAFFFNPKVLVLDEPFNHLDPSAQIVFKKMLIDINRNDGTTILVSSHNLNHVNEICKRIIVLNKGKIIMDCDNNGSMLETLTSYF